MPAGDVGAEEEIFIIEGEELSLYKGDAERVRVPDNVRVIGEDAFSAASVERVELPEGLTAICDRAFIYCNDLAELTAHYYERGHARNAKYTL